MKLLLKLILRVITAYLALVYLRPDLKQHVIMIYSLLVNVVLFLFDIYFSGRLEFFENEPSLSGQPSLNAVPEPRASTQVSTDVVSLTPTLAEIKLMRAKLDTLQTTIETSEKMNQPSEVSRIREAQSKENCMVTEQLAQLEKSIRESCKCGAYDSDKYTTWKPPIS